jgi:SPP1 gp7 family putative phage head morphogenesis protein
VKRTLAPIVHRDDYTRLIEKPLLAYLDEVLFAPLQDILENEKVPTRENARKEKADREKKGEDVLRDALLAGTVWYAAGVFSGKFNAAISRKLRSLGAIPRADGTFHLDQGAIPFALRSAVIDAKIRGEMVHREILKTLDTMMDTIPQAATGIDLDDEIARVEADLQKQLEKSAASVEDLDITPVPEGVSSEIEESTVSGIDAGIKGFAQREIEEIRRLTQANMAQGARVDRLTKIIESQYNVAKRRAAFIAENETSLAISKFREARYKEIGANSYIWSTSKDERVRDSHRDLEGKSFSWDSPPVVDTATGRRGHPGQDFNCRCVAIPIVDV